MATQQKISFGMGCPECDTDIGVDGWVTISFRTEEFWGAPCRVDESEVEIGSVERCPECDEQTIGEGAAEEHFWEVVAPDLEE